MSEKLTKEIYEAMQVSYLSERHDAIKKLITSQVSLAEQALLDRLEKSVTLEYDDGFPADSHYFVRAMTAERNGLHNKNDKLHNNSDQN